MANEQRRNWSLTWPLILIGLGVLFLLDNFGMWNWDIWAFLGTVWPVILIAIGADILLGGRRRGFIAAAAIAAAAVLWFGWVTPGAVSAQSTDIMQTLDGADQARVTLAPGVARLSVDAAGGSDVLASGNVLTGRGESLAEDFRMDGSTAVYRLESRRSGSFMNFGGGDRRVWDVDLNSEIPLDLRVEAGVGEIDLDLSDLQLSSLSVNTGVGEVLVTLARSGDYTASIEAGVGEVTVRVPSELAARIEASRGIGDLNVRGEFLAAGDYYVSPNWDDADERVDLRVEGGVGEITIETY